MRILLDHWPLPEFRYSAPLYYALVYVSTFMVLYFLLVPAKWLLVGRARPGPYQDTMGRYILRWFLDLWLALAYRFGILLEITQNSVLYFRMLGAKLGRDFLINPTMVAPYAADLFSTDGDTFISRVQVLCDVGQGQPQGQTRWFSWWERPRARAEVHVGSGCSIGVQTWINGGTRVPPHTAVGALTLVSKSTDIPPMSSIAGNPPAVLTTDRVEMAEAKTRSLGPDLEMGNSGETVVQSCGVSRRGSDGVIPGEEDRSARSLRSAVSPRSLMSSAKDLGGAPQPLQVGAEHSAAMQPLTQTAEPPSNCRTFLDGGFLRPFSA